MNESIRKIVLAYSGGLDTSIIIPWLKEHYDNAEIIAMCTDVGQQEDLSGLQQKALDSGASKLFLIDAKKEFITDYLFPLLRSGAIYEGKYLLGTSIARPLQAKHQVAVALKEQADAVAHGCTGKGNDQLRFELTYKALAPHLKVIAPWRSWNIRSREEAVDYAKKHRIPIGDISKKNIYSLDWNIWHLSHEGGDLEDPWKRPDESIYQMAKSPKQSPDRETEITIDFEAGYPVGLNGRKLDPLEMLTELNAVGSENGIGRVDLVETRMVGMKSRGVYETPGGTILFHALRELETITLDGQALHYKQLVSLQYAELVYSGKWFSGLRKALDAFMAEISRFATGSVKLALYKGNILVAGRTSPYSLYSQKLASFGASDYDHSDATGFINLFGLSTKVASVARKEH